MRREGRDNHRPPLLFCVWIVSAGLIAIPYQVWYSTISHEEAQEYYFGAIGKNVFNANNRETKWKSSSKKILGRIYIDVQRTSLAETCKTLMKILDFVT